MYLYLLRVRGKVAELADEREEYELLAKLPAPGREALEVSSAS